MFFLLKMHFLLLKKKVQGSRPDNHVQSLATAYLQNGNIDALKVEKVIFIFRPKINTC